MYLSPDAGYSIRSRFVCQNGAKARSRLNVEKLARSRVKKLGFATVTNLWRESGASHSGKAAVFWGWVGLRGLRGPRGLRGASPERCVCEAASNSALHWSFAVEKRSDRQMFNCASARRSTCEAIKLYAPHKSFAPVRHPLVPLDPWVPLVLTIPGHSRSNRWSDSGCAITCEIRER